MCGGRMVDSGLLYDISATIWTAFSVWCDHITHSYMSCAEMKFKKMHCCFVCCQLFTASPLNAVLVSGANVGKHSATGSHDWQAISYVKDRIIGRSFIRTNCYHWHHSERSLETFLLIFNIMRSNSSLYRWHCAHVLFDVTVEAKPDKHGWGHTINSKLIISRYWGNVFNSNFSSTVRPWNVVCSEGLGVPQSLW